jgi:hypothetical protein
MSRASLAEIITLVRDLIGDPTVEESDEPASHFSDDQIEAALDRRRSEWSEAQLQGIRSRTALGVEQYLRWVAERAPWEDDVTLLDESLVPIVTESDDPIADPMAGVWTFSVTQEAVYISGTTYDVYGAASDLLDQWAISTSGGSISTGGTITEWETDGQRVKRAAASSAERKALATQYRALSLPVASRLVRGDLMGGGGWF